MCWVIFKCVDRLRSIDSYKANVFYSVHFQPIGDTLPLSSRTLAFSSWAWICSWNLLSPLSTLLSNKVEWNPISESVKASNCTCVKRIYCQAGREILQVQCVLWQTATARPVPFRACPWRRLLSQLRDIRQAGWGRLAEDGQEWAFLTNQEANQEATHTERRAGLTSTVPPRQRIQSNQATSGELLNRLKSSLPKKHLSHSQSTGRSRHDNRSLTAWHRSHLLGGPPKASSEICLTNVSPKWWCHRKQKQGGRTEWWTGAGEERLICASNLINENAIHEGIFVVKAKAGTTKGSLFDLREKNNKSAFF